MANAVYPTAKASLLGQNPSIDVDTDTIRAALVKITGAGAVSYSASHQYVNSVDAGIVGTPQALASVTVASGKFTSNAVSYSAVSSAGNTLGLILYKWTGTNTNSALIAWYDTGTNIPATPNGGDISVTPDGTNGWFTL
jgi:hypothetical protein